MCLKFCEFWTFRFILFIISTFLIVLTFLFGPLHTLLYFIGQRPELDVYFNSETDYAAFICCLLALIWLSFISYCILFVACCYKIPRLLDVYVWMTIFTMVLSFVLCLRYLIQCTAIDTKCFDHSPKRKGTDSAASVACLLVDLLYCTVSVLIIFLACNYKLIMR